MFASFSFGSDPCSDCNGCDPFQQSVLLVTAPLSFNCNIKLLRILAWIFSRVKPFFCKKMKKYVKYVCFSRKKNRSA